MTWRENYRPIIAEVIERIGTEDMPLLRKSLRDAFPSPPRKYHPYKTWLDEIKVQLGTKKLKQRQGHPAEINTKTLF